MKTEIELWDVEMTGELITADYSLFDMVDGVEVESKVSKFQINLRTILAFLESELEDGVCAINYFLDNIRATVLSYIESNLEVA